MTIVANVLMLFIFLVIPILWASSDYWYFRKLSKTEKLSYSVDSLEDFYKLTPEGELEWAYGVLEKAAREERDREEARYQENRKKALRLVCERLGHDDLDITTLGEVYLTKLCSRCGEMRKVDRYEDDLRWVQSLTSSGFLLDPTVFKEKKANESNFSGDGCSSFGCPGLWSQSC